MYQRKAESKTLGVCWQCQFEDDLLTDIEEDLLPDMEDNLLSD